MDKGSAKTPACNFTTDIQFTSLWIVVPDNPNDNMDAAAIALANAKATAV
jgi:hypothetical protein